jgi:Homeodomain-like domain
MLRLTLTPDQRAALEAQRRDSSLTPAERDRVEMLLLAASGWSVPTIASHCHCCPQTVRRVRHRLDPTDWTTLRREPPGPAPDLARRQPVTEALERLLTQDRTGTAAQLATALQDKQLQLSARPVRRYLRGLARWRRTVRPLPHKQDPARVAQAKDDLAALKTGLPPAS